ncbi:hypothetical protein MTR67_024075 [Solanum verrucosum]|uniref:Uncharacterized protein n=1 Tax=Solanum verrucosum TaxID=315347 RepID=A0AAF0R101_SOLVR|nr:hypothetical protein MTR67_024075 [Solanum verrucosum]
MVTPRFAALVVFASAMMSIAKQNCFERFVRFAPLKFDSTPREKAYDSLTKCHNMLFNLGSTSHGARGGTKGGDYGDRSIACSGSQTSGDRRQFYVVLVDPRSTYSYVSTCFFVGIDHVCESPVVTTSVSTLGDASSYPKGMIYFLHAQCMMENKCLSYLAHVHDLTKDPSSLETVRVVRKFMDVFPTKLPGVPLDCDIKFVIDLELFISLLAEWPQNIEGIESSIRGLVVERVYLA